MAKIGVRFTEEVQTRDRYTKVNMEMGVTLEGREIPSADVIGAAMDKAVESFRQHVTDSYRVPPRPDVQVPTAAQV